MLMPRIFNFTVNDVYDGDRYGDQDDYQDHAITVHDESTIDVQEEVWTTIDDKFTTISVDNNTTRTMCITTTVDDDTTRTMCATINDGLYTTATIYRTNCTTTCTTTIDDIIIDAEPSTTTTDTNLLYNVNAVQQHDFVCDINRHYLNLNNNDCDPVGDKDNVNSIQAIVTIILEVRMNGMFYIPAKQKYILYLLKMKRSVHFIH